MLTFLLTCYILTYLVSYLLTNLLTQSLTRLLTSAAANSTLLYTARSKFTYLLIYERFIISPQPTCTKAHCCPDIMNTDWLIGYLRMKRHLTADSWVGRLWRVGGKRRASRRETADRKFAGRHLTAFRIWTCSGVRRRKTVPWPARPDGISRPLTWAGARGKKATSWRRYMAPIDRRTSLSRKRFTVHSTKTPGRRHPRRFRDGPRISWKERCICAPITKLEQS